MYDKLYYFLYLEKTRQDFLSMNSMNRTLSACISFKTIFQIIFRYCPFQPVCSFKFKIGCCLDWCRYFSERRQLISLLLAHTAVSAVLFFDRVSNNKKWYSAAEIWDKQSLLIVFTQIMNNTINNANYIRWKWDGFTFFGRNKNCIFGYKLFLGLCLMLDLNFEYMIFVVYLKRKKNA